MELSERFEFCEIAPEDAEEAAEVERICFPPNEACTREQMVKRAAAAPEVFLLAKDRETGRIAGLLNGLATDESRFRDDFFRDAGLHRRDGKNVLLLGLDVLPEYRGRGLARELMARYKDRERARGRMALYLTCLEGKITMYERMGYENLGISDSVWGGEQWYEMRCRLNNEEEE